MKTYSILALISPTYLCKDTNSLAEVLLSKLNPNSKYFNSASKFLNNEITNKRVKRQSLDAMYDMFDDAMMDLGIQEIETNGEISSDHTRLVLGAHCQNVADRYESNNYYDSVAERRLHKLDMAFCDGLIQGLTDKHISKINPEVVTAAVDTISNDMFAVETSSDGMDSAMRGLNCAGACNVPLTLEPLYGYGCWCNLGDALLAGYSTPLDEYDGVCQSLQYCLRCVVIDVEQESPSTNCDPSTHVYNTEFSWDFNTLSLIADCESQNTGDDCGIGMCMCEMEWLNNILSLAFAGAGLTPDLSHVESFDRENACPAQAGHGEKSLQCCGAFPSRRPYNERHFECCDNSGEIFLPGQHECCDNGVKDIGSC